MKKISIYVSVFCLFSVITGLLVSNLLKARVREPTYPIKRHIQYAFTLRNQTNCVIKDAEFWTYAPVKQTAIQRCAAIESSHPYRLISDESGNQILHFTFNDFPPFATKIITIRADLLLSERPNPTPVHDTQLFLRQEKYIESDDPDLRRIAQKLKDSRPVKTAEKIFQWVSGNVQYAGYLSDNRGALYALRHKEGDCTEFMHLFVALCRAAGTPARCIGGYITGKNAALKPGGYHNWAEFYHDGAWQICDPQNRVFMKNNSNYIAMRMIEESPDNPMLEFNRFRFKGAGLKVKMNT
ncbi:MAG: transglutaminase-like domain-containing protein [Thermodesulfobacteriota bacterium]|nr:transglutaminase-like domain-containing protein [Thermodesulfobacteriota bacterium]